MNTNLETLKQEIDTNGKVLLKAKYDKETVFWYITKYKRSSNGYFKFFVNLEIRFENKKIYINREAETDNELKNMDYVLLCKQSFKGTIGNTNIKSKYEIIKKIPKNIEKEITSILEYKKKEAIDNLMQWNFIKSYFK